MRFAITPGADQRIKVDLVEHIALGVAAAAFPDVRDGAAKFVRRLGKITARMGGKTFASWCGHITPDRSGPFGCHKVAQIGKQSVSFRPPRARKSIEILHCQKGRYEIAGPGGEPLSQTTPAVTHIASDHLKPSQKGNLVDLVLTVIRLNAGDVVIMCGERSGVIALTDRKQCYMPPVVSHKDGVFPFPGRCPPGQEPTPLIAAPFGQHYMGERMLCPALFAIDVERTPCDRFGLTQQMAFLQPEGQQLEVEKAEHGDTCPCGEDHRLLQQGAAGQSLQHHGDADRRLEHVDSGAQVKDGVELVNNTGKSLGEIVDSIKRLSDIVSEISAASNEQSTGVEEINRAVSQMDEMTQQNAALVEQSAASAKTLLEQSTGMRERMTFFNVDRQSTSVGALGQQAKASFEARVDPQRTKRVATSLRKVAGSGGAGFVAVDTEEESWKEF